MHLDKFALTNGIYVSQLTDQNPLRWHAVFTQSSAVQIYASRFIVIVMW